MSYIEAICSVLCGFNCVCNMEDYQLVQRQGAGAYAVVWKARRRKDGRIVAIKQLREIGVAWDSVLQTPDVHYPKQLNHPNVLRLLSLVRLRGVTFIIMEFCDLSLLQVLQSMTSSGRSFSEGEVRWVMRRLLSGLAYMASASVMHRDIKPENLLIALGEPGGPQLKICDFGQARMTAVEAGKPLTDYVSTRWYRAPEVLLRLPRYGPAVDVWAAGCVMAELFALRPLFPGSSEADQFFRLSSTLPGFDAAAWADGAAAAARAGFAAPAVRVGGGAGVGGGVAAGAGLAPLLPRSTSPAALAAIAAMLTPDPSRRPTAEAVLAMPFFAAGGPAADACPSRFLVAPSSRPAEDAAARAEAELENGRIARMLAAAAAGLPGDGDVAADAVGGGAGGVAASSVTLRSDGASATASAVSATSVAAALTSAASSFPSASSKGGGDYGSRERKGESESEVESEAASESGSDDGDSDDGADSEFLSGRVGGLRLVPQSRSAAAGAARSSAASTRAVAATKPTAVASGAVAALAAGRGFTLPGLGGLGLDTGAAVSASVSASEAAMALSIGSPRAASAAGAGAGAGAGAHGFGFGVGGGVGEGEGFGSSGTARARARESKDASSSDDEGDRGTLSRARHPSASSSSSNSSACAYASSAPSAPVLTPRAAAAAAARAAREGESVTVSGIASSSAGSALAASAAGTALQAAPAGSGALLRRAAPTNPFASAASESGADRATATASAPVAATISSTGVGAAAAMVAVGQLSRHGSSHSAAAGLPARLAGEGLGRGDVRGLAARRSSSPGGKSCDGDDGDDAVEPVSRGSSSVYAYVPSAASAGHATAASGGLGSIAKSGPIPSSVSAPTSAVTVPSVSGGAPAAGLSRRAANPFNF